MKIFTTSISQRTARLGVLCGVAAQHELTGLSAAALRSGRPSGLPVFGGGTTVSVAAVSPMPAVWQRQGTDAAAERTYALSTIKPNAVAGVRPGLRSTSPPV